MEFRLLGAMDVRSDDGNEIPIAAPKRRTLLATLLLQSERPSSADRLAEALWGDDPPPAAEASLHAHMSRLRRDIGQGRIKTVPAGYQLLVAPGELDVRIFERHVAVGMDAAATERWPVAAAELRSALGMWRGHALADVTCHGFVAYEVARLEELRLTALESRIEADLTLGRHARVTAELEALVNHNPTRERLWQHLIVALYRTGRQADALATYRRLRAMLVEELGIDPSPELQALEARLLQQDPTLIGPSSDRFERTIHLPLPATSLIGRLDEIEHALGIVRSHRMLTLTGPGGIGKTRLAIEIAHRLVWDVPDGALFVDLSAVRDPERVMARIGEVTGGGEQPAAVIGDRRMLLVLDNFEHVIEAAADVSGLLAGCQGLRILVTSRAPLRIGAEHCLEIPPLTRAAAVTLFEERAQAARLAVRSDDVVADIVERLDGLPLAIELAAARLRVLSAEDLRDRLTDRLSLLDSGPRDAPGRHRTLRDTIAWSYDLLDAPAKVAFRKLSVLAGTFDLATALAVAETDIVTLGTLVDHSLVRANAGRYSMLETIREYAVDLAAEHGETSAARDRHLARYLAVAGAEGLKKDRIGMSDGGLTGRNAWFAMCAAERENLELAFEWATECDDADAVIRLYRATGMYWRIVGAIDQGVRWGEAAVAAAARIGDDRRRTLVLLTLSEYPRYSGDPHRALDLKIEALALARVAHDHPIIAVILDDLASMSADLGDFTAAHAYLAEVEAIHALGSVDQGPDRAHTLVTGAEVALAEGNVIEAQHRLDELAALEAGTQILPDWIVECDCLRARTLLAAGREDEAVALFRTVVRSAGELGYRLPLIEALDALAAIDVASHPDRSARLLGMSDRLGAEARLAIRDRPQRDRTIEIAREQLGDETFGHFHTSGRALTIAAIVESVLAGPHWTPASAPRDDGPAVRRRRG